MRRHPLPDDEDRNHQLADFAGRKIILECASCGLRRRYDASAMLARIGNIDLPSLRLKIAAAEGCPKVGNPYYDRCRIGYDVEAMGLR